MTTIRSIDLNADVGEGADDAALISLVSSVNIACGGHAGDEATIAASIEAAVQVVAAIGAHPGYPDPTSFGRRSMEISDDDLCRTLTDQIERVARRAMAAGTPLSHVKPHGALYHDALESERHARIIVETCATIAPTAAIVGPPDSALVRVAASTGVRALREAFADRRYDERLRLIPRSDPRALIVEPHLAVEQVLTIATQGVVVAVDGQRHRLEADTISLHSDTPRALESARAIRDALRSAGIRVAPARGG